MFNYQKKLYTDQGLRVFFRRRWIWQIFDAEADKLKMLNAIHTLCVSHKLRQFFFHFFVIDLYVAQLISLSGGSSTRE